MGTKFGHFSVDMGAFERLMGDSKPIDDKSKMFITEFLDLANSSQGDYFVGKNGKWHTIINESFDWGNTEDITVIFL